MKRTTSAVLLVMSLVWAPAFAGTQSGQITSIIKRASDELIYFFLSGQATGRPQCAASQSYWMIKDENSVTGKQQLVMLMTARATGQTVNITGSNTCLRWGDGEDVDYVQY